MSERSSHAIVLPYALPCASLVYRIIPAQANLIRPDGTPDPALFYRKIRDRDGVSVATTVEAGLERFRNVGRPVEGALSLHVGWVRDIEPFGRLDVRSKHAESTHAAITGLPYEDDDLREAEKLANELLKLARRVPLPE